jgi:gentisate 1,2-dioxygenase
MPNDASPPPLLDALAAAHAQPLWDRYRELVPAEPRARDPAMQWAWQTMQPLIDRAVSECTPAEAERRVLMLVNPAFGGEITTTTNLFGGLQILEPGESARPHRHTLAALRFVMDGYGGATIVNGKRCPMHEGDLILTPAWCWHEHVNDGHRRVVWFDGLDLPLARHLDATFFEAGEPTDLPKDMGALPDEALNWSGLLPATFSPPQYSPLFRYAWMDAHSALAALPPAADGSRMLRYVSPATGRAVLPTLDCYLLGLAGQAATRAQRSMHNAICVVVEGEGVSQIGDRRIEWGRHDVFTVPHWNWVSHKAAKGGATLFMMTDRELIRRMGYLREEQAG